MCNMNMAWVKPPDLRIFLNGETSSMDMTSLLLSSAASVLGFAYTVYGKKQGKIWFALSGVALMSYTYFVDSLSISLILGAVFLAAPFLLEQ